MSQFQEFPGAPYSFFIPLAALSILPGPDVQVSRFIPKVLNATNTRADYSLFINYRTLHPEHRSPTIVGMIAGSFARTVEASDPDAIVQTACEQLRATYGSALPQPIATKVTGWTKDPFALGSYSFLTAGTGEATYTQLEDPILSAGGVPWLIFAGEAANSWPYPAEVHGAWLSGSRAANVVISSKDKA